jgi:uncharacterized protein YbaR (Trm112 family)
MKSAREYRMQCLYGISAADYDRMREKQGGKCPICKRFQPLVVDHNHETGAVRGLLCRRCNTALGHFNDDPALLEKAAAYIERGALLPGRVTAKQETGYRKDRMVLSHNGETLPVEQWASRIGLSTNGLRRRIKRGWPVEKALSTLPR